MKVLCGERQSGKTRALIEMSAETGFFIVCLSHQEARRVMKRADDMGKFIPFPLTFTEFLEGRYYAKGVKGVLIDEAINLLQAISRVPVAAVTVDRGECIFIDGG